MVTTRDISPEEFKAKRLLAKHKQGTLAEALDCSEKTIRDFEKGKTQRCYAMRWADLARELKLPTRKADA